MKTKYMPLILLIIGLIAGIVIGKGCAGSAPAAHGGPEPASHEASIQFWTCSMHPQIKQPGPGKCPLCGMDLIPVTDAAEEAPDSLRELKLSPTALALAEVETTPVQKQFPTAEIRMVGKVDFDETRMAYLTAWVAGRLDRLFVDFTGVEVQKGDHMVYIYSPELLTAQEEFIQALETLQRMEGSSLPAVIKRAEATIIASREKLNLLGLTQRQIRDIETRGKPEDHLTIYSPMSGTVIHKNALEGDYVKTGQRIYTIADLDTVWVMLDAYESDLAWLHYGQEVEFETEAHPGQLFTGKIAFIDPVLNEKTRTVRVRVNVKNEDGQLTPGMFVKATVQSQLARGGKVFSQDLAGKWICPMHPEEVKDGPGDCDICGMDLVPAEDLGYVIGKPTDAPLVIPVSAALITGKRAVVYVKSPEKDGTFEGREILLGPKAGDVYLVRRGLQEGEDVVTRGAFKLDAELQINAKPSMMTPDGGGGGSAHNHGPSADDAAHQNETKMESMDLPSGVQIHLHRLMATAQDVAARLPEENLQRIRDAFSTLAERVDAVPADLLQGASAQLWKEYAMLIGNDAVAGAEAKSLTEAKQAGRMLQHHIQGLSMKMGLSHHPTPEAQSPAEIDPVFQQQLGEITRPYLAIQTALAEDDAESARHSARQALTALAEVDMARVESDAHLRWMKRASELKTQLQAIENASSIEGQRAAFLPLSDTITASLRFFGHAGAPLFQITCPMAFDGTGGSWLQSTRETRNPYYGSSMLGCGSVTDTLAGAPTDEEHHHD